MSPHINTWLPKWRVKLQSFHLDIYHLPLSNCCSTWVLTYYDLYRTFFRPSVSFPPSQAGNGKQKNRENKWNTTVLTQRRAICYPCQLKLSERCLSGRKHKNRCTMLTPKNLANFKALAVYPGDYIQNSKYFLKFWSGNFLHWGLYPFPTMRKWSQRIDCS